MLTITFPMIDPIIAQVGPLAIRWYSMAYVAGILLGWLYLAKLNRRDPAPLSKKAYDDIIIWAIFGIILGGRIGYVSFYNFEYYSQNPAEILAVWQGGMSFHGGLIGVITAIFLMCKRYKLAFLPAVDVLACVAPIGLFFGRIANFINGELYGRITDVSWGVVFPHDPYARHPSQLYEAGLEGLLLLIILWYVAFYTKALNKGGVLSGLFLIGYALSRASIELFREPDTQLGFFFEYVTMGQLLCIPMLLLGIVLIIKARPVSQP